MAQSRPGYPTSVPWWTYDRNLTRAKSISGTVLVVAPCTATDALLEDPVVEGAGLSVERADDPDGAIRRVDSGDAVDVVLLGAGVKEPVRVAQRLHSLDRDGAVIVLTDPEGEAELRHALDVAPFLEGDVLLLVRADAATLAEQLAAATQRTRGRREEAAAGRQRRETPPPLSARYLGTLLDSVPIGLVTLDAQGDVIGWNKRAGGMLDVPEVEQLGKPFAALFDRSDHDRLRRLIDRLGSTGIEDEAELFERDGRWYEMTGARFAIRSGEGGTLLILQDVTKRRLAERELEVERALLTAQADSSLVGIAVITIDGTLERINKRFSEMWSVDAEVIGADPQRALELMRDQVQDPDAFMAGVDRLSEGGAAEHRDEVTLTDGRVIERYGTYVVDDAGRSIGRIWFYTDITAHRREEEALRFLADATNLLSSSLDYEVTLQNVAELSVSRIADWCSVEIAGEGISPAHEPQLFHEITDEQLSGLARDDEQLGALRALGACSVMVVPITVRDRVFGAINFVRGDDSPPYTGDDAVLAHELARRAAIAIDNARVHAELRDTARTLQQSLLPPHLPAVRGLEIGARFRPAGAGMQVGGDFYDVFERATDQWGFVIGDVCGKGAEAAALTALTRYTVRAAAMYEDEAGGVLAVLNEALLRQRGDFRFTTVAYCVLDLGAQELRVASGGHPRPLVLRAGGSVEPVGASGPLLGVVSDAEFGEQRIELGSGDAVVLYTDGLTDALAPARILDEDDLIDLLSDCTHLTAREISGRLEQFALEPDPERAPRDDIALVVARLA